MDLFKQLYCKLNLRTRYVLCIASFAAFIFTPASMVYYLYYVFAACIFNFS